MRLAVSRCLLGDACRYDGRSRPREAVIALARRIEAAGGEVVGVCPEVAGGLPVPRTPAELRGGRVITRDGHDVTKAYVCGAHAELARAREGQALPLAVLCDKSPSCGSSLIYDGTHTGRIVAGSGVFCRLLQEEGIAVASEADVYRLHPTVEHPVAVVLGSGLGHLSGLVKPVRRIDYRDIEGFPETARPLPGHRFEATVGTIDAVPVVVYPGRVHLYQGYDALEVTSLVRHAHGLGCRSIVFACATGAVRGMAEPGLGLITDHVNLTGTNPLVGWAEHGALARVDADLFDMADIYSPYLAGLARGVASDLKIPLTEGVLAGVLGPTFETGAEVRALSAIGVSWAGMSTVVEAIMAHALGMDVLGLTLAANYAGERGVTHQSVLNAARLHATEFESLVRRILKAM